MDSPSGTSVQDGAGTVCHEGPFFPARASVLSPVILAVCANQWEELSGSQLPIQRLSLHRTCPQSDRPASSFRRRVTPSHARGLVCLAKGQKGSATLLGHRDGAEPHPVPCEHHSASLRGRISWLGLLIGGWLPAPARWLGHTDAGGRSGVLSNETPGDPSPTARVTGRAPPHTYRSPHVVDLRVLQGGHCAQQSLGVAVCPSGPLGLGPRQSLNAPHAPSGAAPHLGTRSDTARTGACLPPRSPMKTRVWGVGGASE